MVMTYEEFRLKNHKNRKSVTATKISQFLESDCLGGLEDFNLGMKPFYSSMNTSGRYRRMSTLVAYTQYLYIYAKCGGNKNVLSCII